MTAEYDIATRLAAKGFGTVGTSIFVNTMPATPANCIAVSVYAGRPPDRTHDGSGNDHPSIQIRVRNTSASTALSTINNIYNHLDGLVNTTLTSTYYVSIFAINSGAIPMGKDENGRTEYAWNFETTRRR